jgi:hypothetical protein
MTTLSEELRHAYEATDQILASRPDNEFVVIYKDHDGLYLYVMEWDDEHNVLVSGVSELEHASRFDFCDALDVKAKLDDDFDEVVVMLPRDAPTSLVYQRVNDDRTE